MSELNFLYVPANHMGYGRTGTQIDHQLREMGVDTYNHLLGTEGSEVLAPDARTGRCNVCVWMSTPTHAQRWWKGQQAVMFTMWESMRLPEAFRDTLHHFDTIIVPSPQNLELFGQYHDNVKYVPLGVDPYAWCYRERLEPTRRFNYLVSGSGSRKGIDLVVKAFRKLWGREGSWGDGPVPHLLLKGKRPTAEYHQRIEHIAGTLSDEDEIALYAMAHCYVQPSRGEGFGLQPLQAISQGLPTILTGAHGHGSYAHLGMPLSWKPSKTDYFIFGDAGEWWEPDFDELVDHMRSVYENYDEATARAKVSSSEALSCFTWNITANGMLDAIGRDRLTPYEGPDEWFIPEQKLYPIVVDRDHHCNVGGVNYFFEAGKEYFQLADVKRVLFEAGRLSVKCLDETAENMGGLSQQQVDSLGAYRAEKSRCPTCLQSVNAG